MADGNAGDPPGVSRESRPGRRGNRAHRAIRDAPLNYPPPLAVGLPRPTGSLSEPRLSVTSLRLTIGITAAPAHSASTAQTDDTAAGARRSSSEISIWQTCLPDISDADL